MKMSQNISNIAAAIVMFQSNVSSVKESSTNPAFKSKYADLDEIILTITAMRAIICTKSGNSRRSSGGKHHPDT